jgi:hypothetical protein
MPSREAWHRIGHLLAPKEPWDAIMEAPGLRLMLMEGRRQHVKGGTLYVKVEPSVKVERGLFARSYGRAVDATCRQQPESELIVAITPASVDTLCYDAPGSRGTTRGCAGPMDAQQLQ